MDAPTDLAPTDPALTDLSRRLDRLVDEGGLEGWAAGTCDQDGTTRLAAGGRRTESESAAIASCTKPIAGVLALRLVELGVVGLDDPVGPWLPELAEPRVLARPDGALDDTVASERPITLWHLLTMTPGFGFVAEGGPLADAMTGARLAPGPYAPPMGPEEYLDRLGRLPLADQPGTRWRYHTSSDVLGVLLARLTGQSVAALLNQHVTGPLGMRETGFAEDAEFESLATGLHSTVADQLRFLAALADDGGRILGIESTTAMRTGQLTDAQRAGADEFLGEGCSWGHHVEVRPDGCFGWAGGLGTIGYADPRRRRAAVLFTWQGADTPGTQAAFDAFWGLLA